MQNNEVRSWSLRRTTNSSAFLEHEAGIVRNESKWADVGQIIKHQVNKLRTLHVIICRQMKATKELSEGMPHE